MISHIMSRYSLLAIKKTHVNTQKVFCYDLYIDFLSAH